MKKKEYVTPALTVVVMKAKYRLLGLSNNRTLNLKNESPAVVDDGGELD